jgi:hypothetical protein
MKLKLFALLFLAGSIVPNLLFGQFTQQDLKLVGTGEVGHGNQGSSVSISSDGNTAIVGGSGDNSNAGAVWIFTRSGSVWTQQGPKLIGTGAVGNAKQGASVGISADGNTVIVGGYSDNSSTGAVWIFTRSGGVWSQQGSKLVGTGFVGPAFQGCSVSISADGNTAVTGGYLDNSNQGAVWIFTRSGGVWTQQGPKLSGTGAIGVTVDQGNSVAISADGNTVIEGGYEDNNYRGAVWIFTQSGGVWTQQGSKLVGTGATGSLSQQGISVAISSDGNTAIEGGNDDGNAGAVWVFTQSGGIWTQQGQKLVGTGAIGIADQGFSVAISGDGNTAIIGGYVDNSNAGAIWVFIRNSGIWTQQGQKLIGTGSAGNAEQGSSVAISADGYTAIVGGPLDNASAGAVWIFVSPGIGITPISNEVPAGFSLSQNYPNPFNPATKFQFQIAKLGNAMLVVYDMLGREVSTLVNQQLKPGTYEIDFEGSRFSSGVYFYRLISGDYSQTRKLIINK